MERFRSQVSQGDFTTAQILAECWEAEEGRVSHPAQANENLKAGLRRSLEVLADRKLARAELQAQLSQALVQDATDHTEVRFEKRQVNFLLEDVARQKAADAQTEEKLQEALADLEAPASGDLPPTVVQNVGIQTEETLPDLAERATKRNLEAEANDAEAKEPSLTSRCQLLFRRKDIPAVVEDTGSTDYFGHIVSDAKACIVSFPGKYQSGWEALIDENASHKHSVGCVFLCTPESGLGKHAQDPDAAEGVCYCPKIYGNKDYNKLGYLKLLRKGSTQDEEKQQRLNAECKSSCHT